MQLEIESMREKNKRQGLCKGLRLKKPKPKQNKEAGLSDILKTLQKPPTGDRNSVLTIVTHVRLLL